MIGGTSLFGGRGSAVVGAARHAGHRLDPNGMLLLNLQSDAQFMITGAVLLAAVTVDAVRGAGSRPAAWLGRLPDQDCEAGASSHSRIVM